MLQPYFQQGIYVFIGKGVINRFSLTTELDKRRIPEDTQLVGYGRLFHDQFVRQITDTTLSSHQCLQDAQARRVTKDLENTCQRHDIFLWHRSLL